MRSNHTIPAVFFFGILLLFSNCKEESYIYEVNEVTIGSNPSDDKKQKTNEQYINILYANLYQKALSPNKLYELSSVIQSIGDKQVAYETIVAKMLNDPEVVLPTAQEMRADLGGFITETYKRFYVRLPSEAEKSYFVNFLESHPDIEPEHVYFSMATSNEYYYY